VAEVILVMVALGGVSAYVWSVIVQADTRPGGSTGSSGAADGPVTASLPSPLSPRELIPRLRTLDLPGRIGSLWRRSSAVVAGLARGGARAARAQWARRVRRPFERGARRIRFEETAKLTVPLDLHVGSVPIPGHRSSQQWLERPSRLLAALELVLLIVVVGAIVAAVVVGLGELVANAVGSHTGG
jgi:hypothetical protein